MDTAFCVEDGELWDARTLSDEAKKQAPDWLEKRRQTFICGGCEEKARFINAEKRIPHFGVVRGREHAEDCDYGGAIGKNDNGAGAPLPVRAPAQGNKEVRYTKPGPLTPAATGGNGGNNGAGPNGGNQVTGGGPLHETTKLATLLKNLRNRPDYPPENLYLDVPARGPAVRATDYFYKIADITRETTTDGQTHAFWGQISSAQDHWGAEGKETLWINCDGKGRYFTIRLEYDVKDELYKALAIKSSGELYDAHVIVEGIMSKASKLSVNVTDLAKIAFLPKR